MSDRKNPKVVVMGAGMTGILVAIKLKEMGINDFVVLEKCESVGGTWRENTYPGVACDVPSHAYTYSFELNPDWSNHFPSGKEIHQYFQKIFEKYGIDKHTHFNEAVTGCEYNEDTQQWTVTSSQNNTYVADLVFSATGILHQIRLPDIDGLDSFAGATFHTARWDHDVELTGKRVGIIGTGSTAIQAIAGLATLLQPFLPFTSPRAWALAGCEGEIEAAGWQRTPVAASTPLPEPAPLFRKLDDSLVDEEEARLGQ